MISCIEETMKNGSRIQRKMMTTALLLEIEIDQNQGIFISQKKYAENLLNKFEMNNCKTVATPLVVNEKLLKEDGVEKADL